ncbi:hypothetical protein ACBJ59_36580 [Nonomuraea sp. MTCD27]|uniref:hypothetical protein n=1 Tax=Nonomuraea sp. MTCD27 TaxID=1676747 RepID=UPI0035C023A1
MADRTVSVNLRAKVTQWVSGMGQAARSTDDLSRKMVQTGAHADQFRRRLEAATKALPKIEIDADSSPAEIKFAQLRAQMEQLADKKIGIDIDAASAQAQLQEIQRELEQLQGQSATIDVKADIGSALAELRAVDSEISRVNGRDARVQVDADVSGALASIAMVGAALASLPAVTTLAVGVTALGGAFAAAGAGAAAFGAVAVPSLGRINDALKAQESAAKAAGGATGGAGQSAAQAAQQALQLEQAERRLKDAQNERRQAQEDLTRAVEDGRRALEDMNFSLERSVLSQKDAALAVREAEQRLAELRASGNASELDIERAMLNVDMAHQRAREQETKTARAKKDTAAANREGVKGTEQYQRAQERLAQAEAKVTEAAKQLKIAQLQANESMAGGGGGASKLADAFAGLSKQEKILAKDIKAFKDEYIDWQRSLQPDVFPAIHQGLDLMRLGLEKTGPLAKTAGASFLTLGKEAEKALRGPFWTEFLYDVNTAMPTAIEGLGRSFGNVVTGIAGVIDAFLPFTPNVVNPIENASKAFAEWGQNLESNPEFHQFLALVREQAPEVWELIQNIAKALVNVGEAVGPLGVGAFAGLNLLAEIVAGMEPERIRDIALAIAAIKVATMGMSAISAWQGLAGGITATGAAAGKAQGKMAALGKAAIGASVAFIGLEVGGGLLNDLAGQSEGIGELTLALTELGQTGKWAGDLGEQWGGTFDEASKSAGLFADGLRELQDPSFGEMYWLHPLSELTAILPGIDSTVDQLEQKFADMDKALAGMVTSGNAETAAQAFQELAKQAQAQGIPIEKLNQLLPTYNQTLRVSANAAAEAATGVDQAKLKMDGFNTSLGSFASRTDALQAMQALKTAFDEAKTAIDAANGKLQISAGMTDKQRAAVVLAREQFATYIEKVRAAADGAQTLSGKTTDGTRAIAEQLPQLAALAGKNQEAREQILKLAEAYGISRNDAIKAMGSAKGLRDMLAQLKSKEIKITADTEAAKKALRDLLNIYIKPIEIPVSIRAPATPKKKRAGGIEQYAAGGIRSMPPNVATSPTILYGEGAAAEAFIPYELKYRDRAIALLSQVANDFGLQLNNRAAASSMSDLSVTIDDSGLRVADGLTSVMGSLEATMGQAGTLTSSINKVGSSADELNQAWVEGSSVLADSVDYVGTVTADSVTVMSTSVDGLTVTVKELVAAIASGADGKTSGKSGSKANWALNAAEDMLAAMGIKPGGAKKPPANTVEGHTAGGVMWDRSSAFSQTSPVNSSRVSAPQQVSPAASAAYSGGMAATGGSGGGSGSGGSSVNFYGATFRETVDADVVTAKIGMVLDSRG